MKNKKKSVVYGMRLIAIFMVMVLVFCGCKILDYFIADDTDVYARITMKEFYEQDNIDILFVGASHGVYGIDPQYISEQTGQQVFNASSPSQKTDASLALIQEALNLYDVQQVFLELSGTLAERDGLHTERTDLTSTYIISDYMKPSFNKYRFILGSSSLEYIINNFFPARRTWERITDMKYLSEIYQIKQSDAYRDYTYELVTDEDTWYAGLGHVKSSEIRSDPFYFIGDAETPVNLDGISTDWEKSLNEIIELCNKNDIKLTIYAAPVSNYRLLAEKNYDDYIAYVNDFLAEREMTYTDFNLIDNSYFSFASELFYDGHHMNLYGTESFSKLFVDFMEGKIPEDAFWNTVNERLDSEKPVFYGISCTDRYSFEDGGYMRTLHFIANHSDQFEYRVVKMPYLEISVPERDKQFFENEEEHREMRDKIVLREFGTDTELIIPAAEHGIMTICYRLKESPNIITTIDYEY